jgi:hypothetical protein
MGARICPMPQNSFPFSLLGLPALNRPNLQCCYDNYRTRCRPKMFIHVGAPFHSSKVFFLCRHHMFGALAASPVALIPKLMCTGPTRSSQLNNVLEVSGFSRRQQASFALYRTTGFRPRFGELSDLTGFRQSALFNSPLGSKKVCAERRRAHTKLARCRHIGKMRPRYVTSAAVDLVFKAPRIRTRCFHSPFNFLA